MTTLADLTKGFHLSHQKVYMASDPMPYVGDVTIPSIVHPVETFDNTSTSGPIELADPFRFGPSGDGEIKFEGWSSFVLKNILSANKLNILSLSQSVAALGPTMDELVPLSRKISIGAQFFDVNFGTQRGGTKPELTAKYKMTLFKIKEAGQDIIDFDFIHGVMKIDGKDIMVPVNALL